MTCETIQNLLLALPDPSRPTGELRTHVATCPACQAVQAEVVRIEGLLTRLPVPSSEARKVALLNTLDVVGPIIRSIPVAPSARTGSGAFQPVSRWLATVDLRWVGGIAAAILVTVGAVWYANRPKPPVPEVAEKPRHDLLTRTVKHTTDLARATTPPARLAVFTEWSADLKDEARAVYKVAPAAEMNSLARQYEKVVQEGVRKQAELIDEMANKPSVIERQKAFATAIAALDEAVAEAEKLWQDAPQDAKAALKKIAETAKSERTSLTKIQRGT
jgi:hypothetical protein